MKITTRGKHQLAFDPIWDDLDCIVDEGSDSEEDEE